MIALLLVSVSVAASPAAQQGPDRGPGLVVVSGLRPSPELPVEAFDLGSGGLDGDPVEVPRQQDMAVWRSPGGVLVRVAKAGVKFDFPSKQELLVDPRGRIHLRDGSKTLPALHGVDLILADRTRVAIKPSSSNRRPIDSVEVDDGVKGIRLWGSKRRVRNAGHRRDARPQKHALAFRVLGDGDVLYEIERRGPLVNGKRILCPRAKQRKYPEEVHVVLGDVLSKSLRDLEKHLPTRSMEYPDGPRAAAWLARLSPRLFARGIQRRPANAVGEPIVRLHGDMQLALKDGRNGVKLITLAAPHAAKPLVEWSVGDSTTLRMLRQDHGNPGTPRYFQRGMPVKNE